MNGMKPKIYPESASIEKLSPGQSLYTCDGCGTEYWMRAPATSAWCFVCWTWTSYSKASQERQQQALQELREAEG